MIDLLAGETQDRSWRVMKRGGTLVCALGEPNQEKAKAAGVQGRRVSVRPDGQQLREIGKLIEAGHVKVEVSRTFPLDQVAEAHNQVAAGHTRGKVVLTL